MAVKEMTENDILAPSTPSVIFLILSPNHLLGATSEHINNQIFIGAARQTDLLRSAEARHSHVMCLTEAQIPLPTSC